MNSSNEIIVKTNIEGVEAYLRPPDEFDALKATDAQLSQFGFPHRTGSAATAESDPIWKVLVDRSFKCVVPKLTATDEYHGPARVISKGPPTRGIVPVSSENWSGFVLEDSSNPFAISGTNLDGAFILPKQRCKASNGVNLPGMHYSASWIGIDGFNSNDVLQAGTSCNIECDKNGAVRFEQFAWIEWFPKPSIKLDSIRCDSGDLIFVRVWWEPKEAKGRVILVNNSNKNYVNLRIDPPPGIKLVGNCVEWIVERPKVNGVLSSLANYDSSFWRDASFYASFYPGPLYPGKNATGTMYNFSMLENGKVVSAATIPDPSRPREILFVFR